MSGILDTRNNPDLEAIQPTFGEANCFMDYVFIPRGHHPEVQSCSFEIEPGPRYDVNLRVFAIAYHSLKM